MKTCARTATKCWNGSKEREDKGKIIAYIRHGIIKSKCNNEYNADFYLEICMNIEIYLYLLNEMARSETGEKQKDELPRPFVFTTE